MLPILFTIELLYVVLYTAEGTSFVTSFQVYSNNNACSFLQIQ